MNQNPVRYWYRFQFPDEIQKDYLIELDPTTLSLIRGGDPVDAAEWTMLGVEQCHCCPLTADSHPWCPIALNIMKLVQNFKDLLSYHDCTVICEANERCYSKKTSVMEGLSAIFGVVMATSDCPVMEFLKPMARFHLPFATIEETTVRTAAMFLLAQYFRYRDHPEMCFDFKFLEAHYAKVQQVNEGLLRRIKGVSREDADKNAIITLHSISQFLSMEIDSSLSTLAPIFNGRYSDDIGLSGC